jgi:hypothetical protein
MRSQDYLLWLAGILGALSGGIYQSFQAIANYRAKRFWKFRAALAVSGILMAIWFCLEWAAA